MKKVILSLAVAVTAFASQSQTPEPLARQPLAPTSRPLPHSKHPFIVIAHRGDHTHVPENTPESILEGIRCGVDYVELDLRTTKDGYLVMSHDASVGRMTGGQGNIKDLTLAEIKLLTLKNPDSTSHKVYHIPEFRDMLQLCKGGRMNIYLDFKDADVDQTLNQIKEAGMEKQIVVYLNKPEQYGWWRKAAPLMPLMSSLPDDVKTPEEAARFLQQKPIDVLDNVHDSILLSVTRKLGVAVWLDVQRSDEGPATWDPMLAKDIQGVQTDHPESLTVYLYAHFVSPHTTSWFNIKDFGAVGDGLSLDSKAINKAIDAAVLAGGGTVNIPAGNYLSGSIRLKSNINLLIDQGAVLIAAEVKAENDYDEEEPGAGNKYQDPGHSHWHNSLIWGEDLHDVSVTGGGRIWGRGLYKGGAKTKQSANKAIALVRCRNVLIRDIAILHGGWFAILATGVDNLTLDNVKMDTNRDGVDVDCCRNVRISNCTVNAPYDDAICLKSTFALGFARSTENVTITNCQVSGYDEGTLLDGTFQRTENPKYKFTPTGRIKMGTESNGGFKNISISNCVFEYCEGLCLETVDGAQLEDVTITNITMRDMVEEPIFLRLGSRMRGPKEAVIGSLRRINISNIVAYNCNAENTCTISGIPGHDIEDVQLSNIRIYYQGGGHVLDKDMTEKEDKYPEPGMFGNCPVYGLYVRHAKNITFNDIFLYTMKPDSRPPFEFNDVKGVYLGHVTAQRGKGTDAIILKDVSGITVTGCPGIRNIKRQNVAAKTLR